MTSTIEKAVYEYQVRRAFTYDGTDYKPGDWWTPQGFKNDKNIIKFFVNEAFAQIVSEKPKKPTGRGKASASSKQ